MTTPTANDFPELAPPAGRDLTDEQRGRIRARLPLQGQEHRRPRWVAGVAAAAAVLVVVGGAVALSRNVGVDDSADLDPAATSADGLLTFLSFGGPGAECLAAAPRTVIEVDTVTPPRDLVMTGTSLLDAHGATAGEAWVAEVVPGRGMGAGSFQENGGGLTRRQWQQLGWPDRRSLHSAVLEHGKTYRVFVRVTLADGGRFGGIRFDYDAAGTAGASVREGTVRAAARC